MNTPSSHPADQPSPSSVQPPPVEAVGAGDPDRAWQPLPPLGSDPAIRASTPPEILEAQTAFLRDLPELLKERRGQWVAYYGAKRIGFGETEEALWQECLRQGYQNFLVRCVWPRPPFDYISAL